MDKWLIGVIGVVSGIAVNKVADTIGWYVKNAVQRRRDAADVAKIIYKDTKEVGVQEKKEVIEKANVERYGRIYRKLQKELKKTEEEKNEDHQEKS